MALVAGTKEVSVHFKHLGGLSNDTAVDNRLVVWLDKSCVMQDDDLCIEIVNRLRVSVFIYKDHALAELSPL